MPSTAGRFPLMPREVDVLVAAANGEKRVVTARRFGWSVVTVGHYRRRVVEALDAVNMTHAIALAFVRGVLRRSDVGLDWRARVLTTEELVDA